MASKEEGLRPEDGRSGADASPGGPDCKLRAHQAAGDAPF